MSSSDERLIAYATTEHLYNGACLEPDMHSRDPRCPACALLPREGALWASWDGKFYPSQAAALEADHAEEVREAAAG